MATKKVLNNLYSCEVNGLAEDVYILATSLKGALKLYVDSRKAEPKSITLVEERINIEDGSK